jgi:predicted 2-oxoglutarate/Fe(II)-dependent dioxygenase YbiX
LEPFLPRTWKNGEYQLVRLNERLRFLRYDPGQKFLPHLDGQYRRPDGSGERSFITVQLYLNEGFKGGETTFIDTNNANHRVSFPIKTGLVLIFEHRILHEGTAVKEGRKYAMRTDAMYRPVKKQ